MFYDKIFYNSHNYCWHFFRIKFKCANCHTNPNGGGSLKKFGQTVNSQFLSSGNVVWNSALASIDSDNDGFTNGAELGDPNGNWKIGQSDPNVSEVTNPGNAQSIPSSVFSNPDNFISNDIKINSVYPNPVVNSTEIKYEINTSSNINISLYDANGIRVDDIFEGYLNQGSYITDLKMSNENTNYSSGLYFLVISNGKSAIMQKIYKIK